MESPPEATNRIYPSLEEAIAIHDRDFNVGEFGGPAFLEDADLDEKQY